MSRQDPADCFQRLKGASDAGTWHACVRACMCCGGQWVGIDRQATGVTLMSGKDLGFGFCFKMIIHAALRMC